MPDEAGAWHIPIIPFMKQPIILSASSPLASHTSMIARTYAKYLNTRLSWSFHELPRVPNEFPEASMSFLELPGARRLFPAAPRRPGRFPEVPCACPGYLCMDVHAWIYVHGYLFMDGFPRNSSLPSERYHKFDKERNPQYQARLQSWPIHRRIQRESNCQAEGARHRLHVLLFANRTEGYVDMIFPH